MLTWKICSLLYANDTTCSATSGVSSFQGVWVTPFSQIIFTVVNNKTTTDDWSFSTEIDESIVECGVTDTLFVDFNISEISYVSDMVWWCSMFELCVCKVLLCILRVFCTHLIWVEMTSGAGTSVSKISFLVNVETMKSGC